MVILMMVILENVNLVIIAVLHVISKVDITVWLALVNII